MTEQTTVGSPGIGTGATGDLGGHERSREQREVAGRRGLSEGALVEALVGEQAVRLRTDWPLTLHRLGAVGPVIGLTGNRMATIETVAIYRNIATRGPAAQISDLQTDLCLFLSEWRTGFAVTEEGEAGPRRSLQFFDARGTAVHKVLVPAGGDTDAFDELVRRQASEDQRPVAEGQEAGTATADPKSSPPRSDDRDDSLPLIHSIDIAPAHLFTGPLWSAGGEGEPRARPRDRHRGRDAPPGHGRKPRRRSQPRRAAARIEASRRLAGDSRSRDQPTCRRVGRRKRLG